MWPILLVFVLILTASIYIYRKPLAANFAAKLGLHTPSLYERLGGVFTIAAVINDFSDALVVNPIVGKGSKNQYLKDWHQNKLGRLPGLKFMRTQWLCAIAGGPFAYSPTRAGKCPFSLENAHSGLHITSAEFDEVARVLAETLDKFKVPAQEKSEVLAAFSAHKADVIGGDVKC